MTIIKVETIVKQNNWKVHDAFSELIGDISPNTSIGLGFRFATNPAALYDLFNCVFNIDIRTLNGDVLQYELWIINAFTRDKQRPGINELYEVFENSSRIFIESLHNEANSRSIKMGEIPKFELTEHEIKKNIIMALNETYTKK